MAIEAFTFEPELTQAFTALPRTLFGADPRWIAPLDRDVHAQLHPTFPFYRRPGNDHRRFLALAAGAVKGRVAAFVNADMKDQDGTPVGTVGFFECANEPALAQDLLGSALRWLRETHGRVRVWGPMNADFWHGYRLLSGGFDRGRFLGEPANPPYYPDLFEAAGFVVRRRWRSFEVAGREALEAARHRAASRAPRLRGTGYRFEPLAPAGLEDRLEELHAAVSGSFSGFLGYTPIGASEFASVLGVARHVLAPGSGLVRDGDGNAVGFVLAFHDVAEPRRNRILLHSGGLRAGETDRLPGLARAIFSESLAAAMRPGTERVLFPLVAEDNPIRGLYARFACDRERQYALYQREAA
jgi:hypothetical protein